MLFDTHCHVFDEAFSSDLDDVMLRADGMLMMMVGFNKETNLKAISYAKKYHMPYSVGIHPCDVNEIELEYFDKLEEMIPKAYAIGECGLDYYWHNDNKELQKEYFIKQIELSIKYNKPLIIHVREAINDAYQVLKPYKGKIKGVMHAFTGSLEMARLFIDLGLMIGLGGAVTFKNAVNPKRIAKEIDLENIIIETDCPYLTPAPFRGKRNEPSYVKYTAMEIAVLREMEVADVIDATSKNGIKLFCLEEFI